MLSELEFKQSESTERSRAQDPAQADVKTLATDIAAPSLAPEEEAKQLEALQERLVTLPYGAVTILKDKRLGQGAFGSVYEGMYQGQRVAVKEFNPTGVELEASEALQAFEWETSRLSTLSHSNLVRFYGVCRSEAGKLCIVMELCQGQHLGKQLAPALAPREQNAPAVLPQYNDYEDEEPSEDSGSGAYDGYNALEETEEVIVAVRPRVPALPEAPPLGWPRFWRIALDLAHGLSYLHAEGTLHRDLKSENVLFGLTGRAKLADLGVAQVDELVQASEAKVVSQNLKDYGYAAPEEFKKQSNAKSDMFSYGLLLCEMLQGKKLSDPSKRKAGQLETIPEKCLDPIRALIEQCWQMNPGTRPTAVEAIRQLESCYAECGVSPQDRLLPRLEQLLESQQPALRQYIPSFIEAPKEAKAQNAPKKEPKGSQPTPTIQEALQYFMDQDARVLAILGEGGLGKSLCTYQLAEQLLTAHRQGQSSWLPIFIRPGIPQWRHDALTDGLRASLSYYGLSPSAIDGLRNQRLVFIFDGYDELAGNALGNLPITLGLADFPNAKLIISARPMPDLISALPQKLGFEGNCVVHTLQPFTPEQRLLFLQNTLFWDSLQQQWFASQLATATDLAQSLQNPFVLHLFAQSWESQRKQSLATLKKHEIYATFIRHWIETYASFLPPPLHQALLGDHPLASAQDWLIQNAFTMARAHTFSLESINSHWTQPDKLLNAYAAQQFQTRLDAIAATKQALSLATDPADRKKLTQDLKALERRTLMSLPQYQSLLLSRAKRFLDVAPLKSRNAQYQFIHKSLWEYCTALGVQRSLSAPLEKPSLALRLGLIPGFILEDAAMLSFLSALTTREDRAHWESWVLASRQDAEAAPVSACAITALNGLQTREPGYSFPTDLSGVRIPGANLQSATLSGVDFSHADLSCVQFTGACLAYASFAGACLRNVLFGELPSLKLDSSVSFCAFSPDGRLVAVATDNDVHLYEVETQKRVCTLTGHTSKVNSVAFSPDGGRILSGSNDNSVRVWDAQTGGEARQLLGHTEPVKSVAFSPDGGRIASGSGGPSGYFSEKNSIRLWDAKTGAELRQFVGQTGRVTSVAFSPDGGRIVSGSNRSVRVWDVQTGGEVCKLLLGYIGEVDSVAFSPDGGRIISGSNGSVRLWDAQTGAELRQLAGHTSMVTSVAFSPDGGRIVSGSWDKSVRVWDAQTGSELRQFVGHYHWVTSVAFSPDGGRIVSGSCDKSVRVWDAQTTLGEVRKLVGHTGVGTSVAFSPDGGRIISGSNDRSVRLWDAQTGAELRQFLGHTVFVNSVAFSPDGRRIASGSGYNFGSDNSVRVWDAQTGEEIQKLVGHTGTIWSVAFSPDGGRILSGSGSYDEEGWSIDCSVRVWDAQTGEQLHSLCGHSRPVTSVAFSPDGGRIVSGSGDVQGSDNSVRVWDAQTGEETQKLVGHTSMVTSVAFSPDGGRIVSGSYDKSVRVWDAQTGEETQKLVGHTARVTSVAFSPDRRHIISGGEDGVRVWDALKFNLITKSQYSSVKSISWSLQRDGAYLTTVHEDGSVRCWRLASCKGEAYLQLRWCQGVHLPLMLEGIQLEGAEDLSPMNAALLKQRGAVGEPAPVRSSEPKEPQARSVRQEPGAEPSPLAQTSATGGAASSGLAEAEPRSLEPEMSGTAPRSLTWLADGLQGGSSVVRATAEPDAQAANEASASSVAEPDAAPAKKYVVTLPARVRI